jgi:hypothetical protein
MAIIVKIAVVIFIISEGILLAYICVKDNYKYPLCPKCGNSLYCKRNEAGRAICQIHGDVTDCDLIEETEEK